MVSRFWNAQSLKDSFEFNLEKLKIQMAISDCMFVPSEFLMPHAGVQYKTLSDLGVDCLTTNAFLQNSFNQSSSL